MFVRILLIGCGGVGQSLAAIYKRRGRNKTEWLEKMVLADYNIAKAKEVEAYISDVRFVAEKINAENKDEILALVEKHDIDFIMNAVEPAFNEIIFDAALEAGCKYMDCAMTLGVPHLEKPFELCNVKLGDYQFAKYEEWKKKGCLAVVGSGVEPGMANVFAKYAAKYLFDEVHEVNVRDGDNYEIPGAEIAFGFSIWTTIDECLKPPVIWEKGKGWFTTEHFSEPEIFNFPEGIGPVEVVNVEHEEVLLVPRAIDCTRVTFKYGITREFRQMLKYLEALNMNRIDMAVKVGDTEITPRDFLARVAPNPQETSKIMTGKGSAGTWVTGIKDGLKRSAYLYQVADNQDCLNKYGTNSIVAQTAMGPAIMIELIAKGIWKDAGVYGPDSFDPDPFIELMEEFEFPAGLMELDSEYKRRYEAEKILYPLKLAGVNA